MKHPVIATMAVLTMAVCALIDAETFWRSIHNDMRVRGEIPPGPISLRMCIASARAPLVAAAIALVAIWL